jgi:hypothetical protein
MRSGVPIKSGEGQGTMKRSSRRSKGGAIVIFLGAIAMFAATALATDVALGFLTNMPAYLHIQAANHTSANAIAAHQGDSQRTRI